MLIGHRANHLWRWRPGPAKCWVCIALARSAKLTQMPTVGSQLLTLLAWPSEFLFYSVFLRPLFSAVLLCFVRSDVSSCSYSSFFLSLQDEVPSMLRRGLILRLSSLHCPKRHHQNQNQSLHRGPKVLWRIARIFRPSSQVSML